MSERELLAAATPRPWLRIGLVIEPPRDSDLPVARCNDLDDAELIVAAVNEYEALLDLADVGHAITGDLEGTISPENIDALNAALARLDAARSTP